MKFSRYAHTYDQNSPLQQAAGDHLMHLLKANGAAFNSVLDLGCGTGVLLQKVEQAFRPAECVGVDMSALMLAEASRRLPQGHWLLGDLQDRRLELPPFDAAMSNFVLQWVPHFSDCVQHWGLQRKKQAQKSEIFLGIAIPVEGSLDELYQRMQALMSGTEASPNLLSFPKLSDLDFSVPWRLVHQEVQDFSKSFESPYTALMSIKRSGATFLKPRYMASHLRIIAKDTTPTQLSFRVAFVILKLID